MIEINNVPSLEELTEGIRKIKVNIPDKKTAVDEELLFMRIKGATYVSGDVIEERDIVALKVIGGSDERYNKDNVEIAVGINLYNKDIEDALVGMRINESKTVSVDGADITFTVLSIKKKVYSEITIEQVKADDPTINSVDEYKDKIYQEICYKIIHDKAEKIQLNSMIKKLINTVDIKFNYEEIDKELFKNHSELLEQLSQNLEDESIHDYMAEFMKNILINGDYVNLVLNDGMNKEEYVKSLNDEDLMKHYKEEISLGTRKMYIKIEFCKKNGMDLSKEAYEDMVKKQSEIYNMPVEMYKESNSYLNYRYFNIQDSLNKLLIDYMLKHELIKVIVV